MEIGEVSVAAKDKVERHILSFTNVDLLGTFEGEKSRGEKKTGVFRSRQTKQLGMLELKRGHSSGAKTCQKYVMPTETPKRNSPRLLGRVCVLAMQRLGGATVRGKKFNIGTLILKYNAAYTYGRGGMRHGTAAAR